MAWARFARGDLAGAARLLDRAEETVRQHDLPPSHADSVALYRVQLWLAQGDTRAAIDWARTAKPSEGDEPDSFTRFGISRSPAS